MTGFQNNVCDKSDVVSCWLNWQRKVKGTKEIFELINRRQNQDRQKVGQLAILLTLLD